MLPDAFGCAVANRFGDLLDDDDADPFDLISEAEKKKKKKGEEDKKNKQKKPGQRESQRERRVPFALEGQEPVSAHKQPACPAVTESRNGRFEAHRNTKKAAAVQHKANQEPLEFSVPKSSYDDFDFSSTAGSRGRRGSRGYARNSDNFTMRGKREFDRHDGTGMATEEKRGGRGPWNWGSFEEAASELMEVTSEAAVRPEDPPTPSEENPNPTDEDNEVVVQVAMEMTLDEWKAMQETSRPKAEFNIRKAEDKIPSKAKVIHQSKHLENPKEAVEEMEDDGNFFRKSVNDITTLLDINFGNLARPSRGGRGRGARGGQNVFPERARPRLQQGDPAPDPDDPEDFPALSAGK
ncbi:intracellular hyaluronan-binding protein 4 isoform X1 [Nothobranchius furzeri]|uniref:Hyaluronan binding protein 4 n=3 Tax=Nothobranchius furzeri TaxID=105023 RepID=A0A1A8B624_NOTFU|nr:transcript variant X2 [Nothobranchius furzeri]